MDEPLYPPDLVALLRDEAERLANLASPRTWPPHVTLPNDGTLRRLLNVCYHAGLLREESRPVSFSIILDAQPPPAPPRGHAVQTIPFGEVVPFNEQQVRRLALATAPDTTAIVVRSVSSSPADLQIVGLHTLDRQFYGNRFLQGFRSGAWPHALLIRCLEPGALSVAWGNYGIVNLQGGQLKHVLADSFRFGQLAAFMSGGANDLFTEVCGDASAVEEGERPGLVTRIWHEYTETLCRLLSRMGEYTHGALVLMKPHAATMPECLRMKYQCEYGRIWELLSEKNRMQSSAFELFKRDKDEVAFHAAREHWEALEEYEECAIRFVARLAAVDGAVLIDTHFRLMGFGVEVQRESNMTTIQIAQVPRHPDGELTPGGTELIEKYGTRHRSAFRFCEGAPDCAAFVLSQDGGVKAVRSVGGTVTMWREVAVD